jgi:hypothetical protein
MSLRGYGKKRSLPNLKYYPGNFLVGLSKTTKNLREVSLSPTEIWTRASQINTSPDSSVCEKYYIWLNSIFCGNNTVRAMAQAVSILPLTAEGRVHPLTVPCGICDGRSGAGTGLFPSSSLLPLSVSFHRGLKFLYIIWGMNNRPVGDRSSEP